MISEMGMKAQTRVLKINGKNYVLAFNMAALAIAEAVYEDYCGKSVGCDVIVADLVQGRQRAVMAITYAAMRAADCRITWKEFTTEVYNFENFEEVQNEVTDGILAMMRTDTKGDPNGKKQDSRGGN